MSKPKFVICIENADYPASLERRKIYEALPDPDAAKEDLVRVVDESGEDYLYPQACFIDANLPESTEAAVVKAA